MTLEQVIADAREEAAVLRRHHQAAIADAIGRLADAVQASALDYLNWLSESEARLRSGHDVPWLRARFAQWAEQGLAEWRGAKRYYRAVVIPQRPNLDAARAAGRRAVGRSA